MTSALELQTTYIPHIRKQFETGSIVLFTGAGFSLDAVTIQNNQILGTEALTKLLWGICYPSEKFEPDTQLQDIYEDALTVNKAKLEIVLKQSFSTSGSASPQWYQEIMSMPWLRAYTLNIDNLMEEALAAHGTMREVNTISAISGSTSQLSDDRLDVIHLNGSLDDVPENVTFSRSQYAQRVGVDPFYQQLQADLISRPVIFIGSSLEEGQMWEHIISRREKGPRGSNELRPRSYLILPKLNKSKISMLSKFNITWLQMTGEEFCTQVLTQLKDSKPIGYESLTRRGLVDSHINPMFRLVSDLVQDKYPDTEYLLGQEPVWSDLINGRVADLEVFAQIKSKTNELRSLSNINQTIVLTGTAGSGKSSALMWLGLSLNNEGATVAWLDATQKLSRSGFTKALDSPAKIDALLINDADIYGGQLSLFIRLAIERNPRLLVVVEVRSNKVDRVIKQNELGQIHPVEITMPNMTDSDIVSIIGVLEKENRLGVLRSETIEQRISAFKKRADRQLLVAMYEATSGRRFAEKVLDELSEIADVDKLIYGLVATVSAHRLSITRDEILIACGDISNDVLNKLNKLIQRKLVFESGPKGNLKLRHRVIAQLIYDELVRNGQFARVLRGLLLVGVAKTTKNTPANVRSARLLRTILNHNFVKNTVGEEVGRVIYAEFEDHLHWSAHYWLHRGALELEHNQLDMAENFLNQAYSLQPNDVFIENEMAYLLFKKALASPMSSDSTDIVSEAIKILESIIIRKPELSAHAYHVLGTQGLDWAAIGLTEELKKRQFLDYLESKIRSAVNHHTNDGILGTLLEDIVRAKLMLAVTK